MAGGALKTGGALGVTGGKMRPRRRTGGMEGGRLSGLAKVTCLSPSWNPHPASLLGLSPPACTLVSACL